MPIIDKPALHTTGTFPELAIHNHGLRMEAVIRALLSHQIRSLLDLGCGDGALAKKIAGSSLQLDNYVGIDPWEERLVRARTDPKLQDGAFSFHTGSMTDLESVVDDPDKFRTLGAIVLLETIEHVPRSQVPQIEAGVFGFIMPQLVVVTTPDATARLTEEQLEARGHYFEWDIPEFEAWVNDMTSQYSLYTSDISHLNGPTFVRGTQVATFTRN